jgi:hypothetical protein
MLSTAGLSATGLAKLVVTRARQIIELCMIKGLSVYFVSALSRKFERVEVYGSKR